VRLVEDRKFDTDQTLQAAAQTRTETREEIEQRLVEAEAERHANEEHTKQLTARAKDAIETQHVAERLIEEEAEFVLPVLVSALRRGASEDVGISEGRERWQHHCLELQVQSAVKDAAKAAGISNVHAMSTLTRAVLKEVSDADNVASAVRAELTAWHRLEEQLRVAAGKENLLVPRDCTALQVELLESRLGGSAIEGTIRDMLRRLHHKTLVDQANALLADKTRELLDSDARRSLLKLISAVLKQNAPADIPEEVDRAVEEWRTIEELLRDSAAELKTRNVEITEGWIRVGDLVARCHAQQVEADEVVATAVRLWEDRRQRMREATKTKQSIWDAGENVSDGVDPEPEPEPESVGRQNTEGDGDDETKLETLSECSEAEVAEYKAEVSHRAGLRAQFKQGTHAKTAGGAVGVVVEDVAAPAVAVELRLADGSTMSVEDRRGSLTHIRVDTLSECSEAEVAEYEAAPWVVEQARHAGLRAQFKQGTHA
jgi:hypothetical protein